MRDTKAKRAQQRLGLAEGRGVVAREARMHLLRGRTETAGLRCLTFEVSGSRRCGAWPAGRMMKHSGPRAKCHAVGSPLDRGVRHRTRACASLTHELKYLVSVAVNDASALPAKVTVEPVRTN